MDAEGIEEAWSATAGGTTVARTLNPNPGDQAAPARTGGSYAQRTVVAVGIGALAVVLFFLGWQVVELLLLAFAGLLLAAFLRALTDLVADHTPLSGGWALGLVLLLLAAIVAGGIWFLGGRIAAELDQLGQLLPGSLAKMQQFIGQYEWGRQLLQSLGQMSSLGSIVPSGSGLLGHVTGIFSTTLDLLINAGLVLFVGIYLAVDPDLYRRGPTQAGADTQAETYRAGAGGDGSDTPLVAAGRRAALMLTIGVLKGVGLWLLGVPLALVLGVLAGILEFIPNIGPITAGTIAALIALTQSPQQALYVILFTIALQAAESNLLQPLVQQFAVGVPPVLTIIVQLIAATLFGFAGLLVATPLVAVAIPMIRMLYVEDVLGDRSSADNEEGG